MKGVVIAVATVLVVLAVLAALALAGVFDGSTEEDGADPADRRGSTGEDTDDPTSAPAEELIPGETIGTPDNPYSPGDTVVIEDWTFTLGETDTDAWPELAPELERKIPEIIDQYVPGSGMVFVAAPLTFTYTGPPETQNRANGFDATHFATDGTETFEGGCGASGTSVERFDITAPWLAPSEEGVICAEVLSEQADGGQWRISLYFWDHEGKDRVVNVFYTAN